MGERREWFLFFMVSEVSVCCLGAYGKAVCFDGKQVTKEAEPFMVAGKQRERKGGVGSLSPRQAYGSSNTSLANKPLTYDPWDSNHKRRPVNCEQLMYSS